MELARGYPSHRSVLSPWKAPLCPAFDQAPALAAAMGDNYSNWLGEPDRDGGAWGVPGCPVYPSCFGPAAALQPAGHSGLRSADEKSQAQEGHVTRPRSWQRLDNGVIY